MHTTLMSLGREALVLLLVTSAPPLLAALAVGLASGVLQAATQVQDQSLSVVPRLVAVLLALGCAAPWIASRLVRFASACIDLVSRIPA